MPPPTGVVSGPLMPMRYSANVSTVSSGSQLPVSLKAFSPASTSFQAIRLPDFPAAASITSCAAGQMSTPVPSPSMNGTIGSSGTWRRPSTSVIFSGITTPVGYGGVSSYRPRLPGPQAARFPFPASTDDGDDPEHHEVDQEQARRRPPERRPRQHRRASRSTGEGHPAVGATLGGRRHRPAA